MSGALITFEQKVKEVDLYFRFLECTLYDNIKLHFPSKKTWRYRKIDDDLKKILKANSFLIIYNLVESTVRNGINEIFDTIKFENSAYEGVSDDIRKLWLREKFNNLETGYARPERFRKLAFELIQEVLDRLIVELSVEQMPISGNIDASQIRKLARRIGFSSKTVKTARGGEKLEIVREMRNSLAHGALSFAECGRSFTGEELSAIKKEVVVYLRSILRNMARYAQDRKFVRA